MNEFDVIVQKLVSSFVSRKVQSHVFSIVLSNVAELSEILKNSPKLEN